MSIKALALELYHAQQKVDMIKKKIETSPGGEDKILENELMAAQKEWQMLRKMLDGQKESGSFIKRFDKFSTLLQKHCNKKQQT